MRLYRTTTGYVSKCGRCKFDRTNDCLPVYWQLRFDDQPIGQPTKRLDELREVAASIVESQPQQEPSTLVVSFDKPAILVP